MAPTFFIRDGVWHPPQARGLATLSGRSALSPWLVPLASSLTLHVCAGVLLSLYSVPGRVKARPTQSGRASLALRASVASRPVPARPAAQVVFATADRDPSKRRRLRPAPTPLKRRQAALEPGAAWPRSGTEEPIEAVAARTHAEAVRRRPRSDEEPHGGQAGGRPPPRAPTRELALATQQPKAVSQPAAQSSPASQAASGARSRLIPELRFNPAPRYPADALAARITGRVILRARVSAEGTVVDVWVHRSSSVASLDRAAEQAVRQWRFAPLPGSAARVVAVPIDFVLRGR